MSKFTLRITAELPVRIRALNRVDNDGGTFRFIALDNGQEYTLPVRRGELRIGEDPRSGPHFTKVGEVYSLLTPAWGRKHRYVLGHDRPKAGGNIARLRQYWADTKEQKEAIAPLLEQQQEWLARVAAGDATAEEFAAWMEAVL